MLEHLNGVVNCAKACCLGTNERAAVRKSLTCEHARELVAKSLVLTEEVADLTRANAKVARGNVGVSTDIFLKLCHKALAEAHDLCIRLTLRIEVSAALTAAHGERGERVLEGLLEAEELDNALVYGRMEAKTALVRTDRAVELNTETAVYLNVAVIVYPRNSELDDPLGLYHSFNYACLNKIGARLDNGLDRLENFLNCLMEFGLIGISLYNSLHKLVEILILKTHNLCTFPVKKYTAIPKMQVLIFEISNIGLIIPQRICVVNKILAKKSPCKKIFYRLLQSLQ